VFGLVSGSTLPPVSFTSKAGFDKLSAALPVARISGLVHTALSAPRKKWPDAQSGGKGKLIHGGIGSL
jgi:hypothetical protein